MKLVDAARLVLCVLVFLATNFAQAGESVVAPEPVYKAARVTGTVLTRAPTAPRWMSVKVGTVLREGQLVQVTNGAAVTLVEQSASKAVGLSKDKVQITITRPMVARLSRDLLRKIKLSPFFLDRANAPVPGERKEDLALTLRDAWNRLAAIVTSLPPPEAPVIELSELERRGIVLGVSAKRIQLVAPVANAVVQSDGWPAEVRIVWMKPPKRSLEFLVYVWHADKPRGAALASTKRDFYTAKLAEPGPYFVQVTSADGSWQSVAVPIHAVAPLEVVSAAGAAAQGIPVSIAEALSAKYPSDGLLTPVSPSLVFSWQMALERKEPEFEVRISDIEGKLIKSLRSKSDTVATKLAPGKYAWSVSLAGTSFTSSVNQFEVLAADAMNSRAKRRQLVQQIISSGRDGAIAFDDEL